MRLIKLEISGFKSFVDATEIRLPSDLTAVVGPNGCGKSNIIDAVRWVMGEASARTLRGDSMSDVIFNGSSARRPVGKAAVELLFDNSDNSAGGSFEKFAEISVKRTLSRDGQSGYFINNIKTRRRDVLDLFRGTGLGPRSYSIIEQGMVSRIVEARPEDLRLFVEEAAGTSKYKDRRRETETRIAHTRENLSRVADIRDELDKQLRRLKRQVSSAKRYRELRDEHRVVKAQLMMLQLRDMEADLESRGREQEKHQNALQEATDAARAAENEAEQLRRQQSEAREAHHGAERDLLALDANIKNLEQRVAHLGAESARLRERSEAREQQLESTRGRLRELRNEESQFAPRAEQLAQARRAAAEQMETAESDMETWRNEWEQFTMQSQQPEREREVQEARIEQVEQRLARGAADLERREKELAGLREAQAAAGMDELREEARAHDETCERAERELAQGEEARHALRERARQLRELGEAARARLHQTESRLASLREIQEAALDSGDAALRDWLNARGFADAPKLAERIDVADGWERAADRLLGNFLGALCVNKLPRDALAERPDRAFMLMEASSAKTSESSRPRLLDKIQIDGADLSALLDGVYAADSLEAALEMQPQLSGRECAVTRDGALVGANWVSFAS
ncbi:MAG: AAA family ATPase, partial [Gammaproteobacteria bacterium]|nr:AAA family ATPase [Gammaproteobacteria bacterium]